ncbi:MAG: DEAD/DEAH box helicase [Gemmatimonadota bacterium]|nr:MAG: DEAD/DEAH box helicase [Gemmatimonadota bacterium]
MSESGLSPFHPLIQRWFRERVGQPTQIQEQAWPKIAAGDHVLVTAPTGCGKTLTAFLWAIHQLVSGRWPTGYTSVLYVSPLKALNNDIYRNLLTPLDELKHFFEKSNKPFPHIRVQTRSGDTPQADRRRMIRYPPEILITTPESLNLMLSSSSGKTILTNLSTVILDEIHAVINNKRGTHLITAVDRLVHLSGEFQRIALSATLKPLETVARFVGGFRIEGDPANPKYTPRDVSIVGSTQSKAYDICVRFPETADDLEFGESRWEPLVEEFKRIIAKNRSTLFFVNNRRLSEKLTLKINYDEDHPVAFAHHGSLSREIRTEVEGKLKAGELKAIVATNSLELGIDIGALDEVSLVQSPPSISSAIQRIGRAGHGVGETSRGTLFPTFDQDFLESAVLALTIPSQDIEEIRPVMCPLDVLAQIIVSMVGTETWDIEALFNRIRTCYPYRHLDRQQFDLVLNMLAGRYADTRIRELKPRISIDRLDNTVAARKGALLALYMSGGVIPDRGYYRLRLHGSGAPIGDLDEEFVWEAKIGQVFTLGTQNWKIERITHNDVFVLPGSPKILASPFWKGEGRNRDFHFSSFIADFMEDANARLDDPAFAQSLKETHRMDGPAARHLIMYLKKQREETGIDLPHRHHIVVEHVSSGPGGLPGNQVILHTLWGGRLNRPYAMALEAAWEERFGQSIEVYAGNDSIVLQLPHDISAEELLSMVTSGTIESLLRRRLEGSGFFGARFRECAGRALLLTRKKINERMPLWMNRLRSQKLMNAVMKYEDFPILLETWRTCLQDEFDLEALRTVLSEIESAEIGISHCRTAIPSPIARNISWKQINEYMYRGDEPTHGKRSRLRSDLFRDIISTPGLRPTVSREIVNQFTHKRQRLSPGYSPSTPRDLIDWVKERHLIPESEWQELLLAMRQDHGFEAEDMLKSSSEKLTRIFPPDAAQPLIAALETTPRIVSALYAQTGDLQLESVFDNKAIPRSGEFNQTLSETDREEVCSALVEEWLQFYGPVSPDFVVKTLGLESDRVLSALDDLIESGDVISGALVTDGPESDLCDAQNFETLLRLARKEAVPVIEPLHLELLPLFLATYHGLVNPSPTIEGLYRSIEQLLCYSAPAGSWESDILPSRLQPYNQAWLDTVLQESDLRWVGQADQKIAFCFQSDLDLLDIPEDRHQKKNTFRSHFRDLFPDPTGKYDFATLIKNAHHRPSELSDTLWKGVWRGKITNDSFHTLRKGVMNQFKLPDVVPADSATRRRRSGLRTRFSRWKGSLPYAGNWSLLPQREPVEDLLEKEELKKDRVRLLIDRYGVLFRELLTKESTPFRWANVFRSLRLMELSGEVLSGYFFEGISGPQFISHRALHILRRNLPKEAIYWMNATDPASCCGLRLEGLKRSLPRRIDTTHLVFHGTRLVFVSKRNGKNLTFHIPPEDPQLQEYLCPLHHLLTRRFQPLRRITIETINDEAAPRSPYLDAIRTAFDTMVDFKSVTLYRRQVR